MNQKESLTKNGSLSKLVLTGEEKWASFRFFREFPKEFQWITNACGNRYALVCYHVKQLKFQLAQDIEDFLSWINREIAPALPKKESKTFIVYYHGVGYLSALYGILISLKSLLDILAVLIYKSLPVNAKFDGWGDKGKRVINALTNNVSHQYKPKADYLKRAIECRWEGWIGEAVRYRDEIVHRGDISELGHLKAILTGEKRQYSKDDILRPKMPNGSYVDEYCKNLKSVLEKFLQLIIPTLQK